MQSGGELNPSNSQMEYLRWCSLRWSFSGCSSWSCTLSEGHEERRYMGVFNWIFSAFGDDSEESTKKALAGHLGSLGSSISTARLNLRDILFKV